ncbi:YcjX family GTP-binding protein [Shewanella sedimentimangrovi]|uniref:YcjX family protein n=1 Tax=Shewanella sedimentimangrovi TaxID=2814293 RepID=A0ABX7R5N9_9GAMM|nr:YcjX family protein [Shewanella sedimentimangrovi]QSX38485.1 YcjX family protein [Shewanella sedimentimangrovi]
MLSEKLESLSRKTQSILARSADRQLRLAVTGLAGAGKTAFITGLVNQLLSAEAGKSLPLWQVCREGRLRGVQRAMQPDLDIASFDYQGAMDSLLAETPTWPESTRNLSEIRLAIRFEPRQGLRAKFSESATLYLDIVDYPGEWLLDLPMLRQDFEHWSASVFEALKRRNSCTELEAFLAAVGALDPEDPADEARLDAIAVLYRNYLQAAVHQQGYYLAQPGRMLLPGELEGTPLLAFFPLPPGTGMAAGSIREVLTRRYQSYVSKVVKPFFQNHFAGFDRQLVLVDCFTALNRGHSQFNDMSAALNGILESFQFGKSSWFRRLFAPRIDKLLFAASKIDHVSRDQQGHVLSLLRELLSSGEHFARFEGSQVEAMAISAIKATRHGMVNTPEGEVEVVQGRALDSGKAQTLFPGEVPAHLPAADFWQQQGFEFAMFAPPLTGPKGRFEHIRLDHLLDYLLADKLK